MIEKYKVVQQDVIFNEEEYGRYLYENRLDPNKLKAKVYSVKELTVLAKYARWILNQPKDEVKNIVIRFCNVNYIGFDSDVNYEQINKVMENAYKTKMRGTKSIPITRQEVDILKSIENDQARKILYVMLMIGKFNRINPVLYEGQEPKVYTDKRIRCNLGKKDLVRFSKTHFKNPSDFYKVFREFGEKGVLDVIPSNKLKIALNFGEIDPKEEDIVFRLNNMEEMMIGYDKVILDKNVKSCRRCGKDFIDNSKKSNSIYCRQCKKIDSLTTKKEKHREITKYSARKERYQEEQVKSFICMDCGEEFEKDLKNNNAIRCKHCQDIYRQKRSTIITKTCECCGNTFEISSKSTRVLCDECYKIDTKKKSAERVKRFRDRKKQENQKCNEPIGRSK